jgi:DNA segregation ATPase FtsK/SpoIIIE, S-DNA-T family
MRVSVRTGPVRWGGPLALVGWAVGRLLVALWLLLSVAVCRPRLTAAAVGLCTAGWLLSQHLVATMVPLLVAGEALQWWSVARPASFRARVGLRALSCWRSVTLYRRLWQSAILAAELDQDGPDGDWRLPQLRRVRCLEDVDVLHVRGLLGQRGRQWEEAGPMLAHVFGAHDVRVHRGDDRRLTLELARGRRGRSWNREDRLELQS